MEREESEKHEHEGSFAEGVEETEHHPEREKGDFAEGEEERSTGTRAPSRRASKRPSTTPS